MHFLVLLALSLPAAVSAGAFSLLSYNVAGLPAALSSSDPAENTPYISARLAPFSIVGVQEDFNYHAALYASDTHAFRTPTSGGAGLGSGLNILSDYAYTDLARTGWDDCSLNSGDCLTPKGFLSVRLSVGAGAWVDVYTLHTDAGGETGDLGARAKNVAQLLAAVEAQSAGMAVVVLGDTNMRYTTAADSARALAAGLGGVGNDAWVALARGGVAPAADNVALTCPFPFASGTTQATMLACETVDKVFVRGTTALGLTLTAFKNEHDSFLHPDTGVPLSDHYPLSAAVTWSAGTTRRLSEGYVGGPHGDFFNDLPALASAGRVTAVRVRGGERVDAVEVVVESAGTLSHGGTGGTLSELTLATGETVVGVQACQSEKDGSTRVFYIKFTTSTGRTLAVGTSTGTCVTMAPPESGFVLKGFWGRSGDELDRDRLKRNQDIDKSIQTTLHYHITMEETVDKSFPIPVYQRIVTIYHFRLLSAYRCAFPSEAIPSGREHAPCIDDWSWEGHCRAGSPKLSRAQQMV
ncbi:Endonuclease/exonuclease/phosphatase [Geopyxis carbonaria]|nr:Endonuclease/exonuclease/phosphatase [Geopyxis carbonaria]